ncbi:MAG TPA: xanthine dehydrogenase family protein molybdopterin-binding subunit [Nitrolancea sp.]|jgi:carbon-monoxide dehydrogenase large subunit|nr:xanthine dehydrogenase family protein molybdopterin-binding subunit [Nitrolancea sp.]
MAVSSPFGSSIKRREDPRLITGGGHYTDDVRLPGMLSMVIVRSPHAHARITSIDATAAKAMPGVVAVYTGADLKDLVAPVPCAWQPKDSDIKVPEYRPLAVDTVRYVGDGVAAVIADDIYTAQDAAAAIEVQYETLPAVVKQLDAMQAGAPQLYDNVPNNVAFHFHLAGGDVDGAFQNADLTFKQRIVNQRLIPNAMEPRGAVASYQRGSNELTLWCTTQNPHIVRLLMSLCTNIPETNIRVLSQDIGGGFGSKIPMYAGEMIASVISKDLMRPIKWVEDRSENYVATTHGRDHVDDVEVAAMSDGRIVGIKVTAYANMGAYLSTAAPGVPTWLFSVMLGGPYDIRNVSSDVYGVLTNTTPTDAYRGAGRPEATYILERMMDLVAKKLNLDPLDVRRTNFIQPSAFPYSIASGAIAYDSGDYDKTLTRALEIVDYAALRREQEEARANGRLLGIGFSTYIEVCGLAPSAAAGAMGFGGGLYESAVVRVHPTGKVTVLTGINPQGQGEGTTFAQLVGDELGVPLDDVEIVWGDTDRVPMGWGTYGSRSTAVGGSAVVFAARNVRDKMMKIGAHLLEVSPEEVVFDQGNVHVKGAPDRVKSFGDIALAAYTAWNMPEGVTPGLEETYFFDPVSNTFPFGAHVCVVEVDKDSGKTNVRRYVAVDDVGNVINPMIVDGQIHGGIAQGLAQAVLESAVYDDNGQLLSGTMMDYAIPKASSFPNYELDRTVTPCPFNPMGLKGVGEAGTIASTPAIMNAIIDALSPYGVEHFDMPATPQRIWEFVQEQKGN